MSGPGIDYGLHYLVIAIALVVLGAGGLALGVQGWACLLFLRTAVMHV